MKKAAKVFFKNERFFAHFFSTIGICIGLWIFSAGMLEFIISIIVNFFCINYFFDNKINEQ